MPIEQPFVSLKAEDFQCLAFCFEDEDACAGRTADATPAD
jgi:hypothetical protein